MKYYPAGLFTQEVGTTGNGIEFSFHQIVQFPDTTKVYDPSTRQTLLGDPAHGVAFDPTYLAVFTDGTTNQVAAGYRTVTTLTIK